MPNKERIAAIAVAILALQGCAATPEARGNLDAVMISDSYANMAETADVMAEEMADLANFAEETSMPPRWWEGFGDEGLDALIDAALFDNPDMGQMRQRLAQAEAGITQSHAELLPSADASAGRGTTRGKRKTPTTWTGSVAASYELDIWGKNRAAQESDWLAAAASADDIRATAITLTASITDTWLRLLALREEEALLEKQIKLNKTVLDLQRKRFEYGVTGAIGVLQQKEVLARAEAQLPPLRQSQALAMTQLAVLAGRDPSLPPDVEATALPGLLPVPDTGIPARLLEDRPDITAAWRRVLSSDWAVEEAWAERLPRIDLTAGLSVTNPTVAGLLDTWLLSLAGALAGPVFDGGARKAEEGRRRAVAQERLHVYRETVLEAVREVEDALSSDVHLHDALAALRTQLEASRDTLKQAQISYANGEEDYLTVLSSLLSVQGLERQIVQARRDIAVNRVSLYRALGGRGWMEDVQMTERRE